MYLKNVIRNIYRRYVPAKVRVRIRCLRGYSFYSDEYEKNRLIFIHVPKTAGSSISDLFLSGMKSGHAHYSAQNYFDESAEKYNAYFKFAFVRHPIKRFISAYNHLSNLPEWVGKSTVLFSEKHVQPYPDINDFIKYFSTSIEAQQWTHFRTQTSFLYVNKKNSINYIGHFETLEKDVDEIAKILNKTGISLDHINKSKIKTAEVALSRASLETLYAYYKEDFINFEYGMDD